MLFLTAFYPLFILFTGIPLFRQTAAVRMGTAGASAPAPPTVAQGVAYRQHDQQGEQPEDEIIDQMHGKLLFSGEEQGDAVDGKGRRPCETALADRQDDRMAAAQFPLDRRDRRDAGGIE